MDSYEPIHTGHGYLPTDRPKLSVFMEDFGHIYQDSAAVQSSM